MKIRMLLAAVLLSATNAHGQEVMVGGSNCGTGGNMSKKIVAFLFGMLVGAAGSAMAAQIVGANGFLIGWDVQKNGETICSSPFVWISLREIECD